MIFNIEHGKLSRPNGHGNATRHLNALLFSFLLVFGYIPTYELCHNSKIRNGRSCGLFLILKKKKR